MPSLQSAIEANPVGVQDYKRAEVAAVIACVLTQATEEINNKVLWTGVPQSALVTALVELSRRLAADSAAWRELTLAQLLSPKDLYGYAARRQAYAPTSAHYKATHSRTHSRTPAKERPRQPEVQGIRGEKTFFRRLANHAVKRDKAVRGLTTLCIGG